MDGTENLQLDGASWPALVNILPQIVWEAEPAGSCLYLSRGWYEHTGLTPATSLGVVWHMAVHPEDQPCCDSEWKRAVATGMPLEVEHRLRGAGGEYRWFLTRAVPRRDERGSIVSWVGTSTDIHAHKCREAATLERLVRERTAELQRSNWQLEEFAMVASHDLQEPLRKIQAFGERLQAKYSQELGKQGRESLERILKSAGRMRTLIGDLLALSRITTQGYAFRPVDLASIACEVVSDLEGLILETGGSVELRALPTIHADPVQIRQVFQNLIGNGLKFHRPGSPPQVRVSARPTHVAGEDSTIERAAWYEVAVEDNGIGFDEIYLERIFQVFQRLHGRSEYEGTGMGLAICRKIVERHSGRITARSSPGKGSTFLVTLPAVQRDGDLSGHHDSSPIDHAIER